MESRWKSRKFLLALSAQVTGILVLLWPGQESAIAQSSESVTALVVVVLSTLGYLHAEGTIDRQQKDK